MSITPLKYTSPESVDIISDKLHRLWYADKQIVAYKLLEANQETIANWGEIASATIQDWDHAKPYLALHDLSSPGVALRYSTANKNILLPGITEEGTHAIQSILEGNAFRANVAVVVSVQFSGHITNTFAQLEAHRRTEEYISFNVFSQHDAALEWLLSVLTRLSK